MCGLYRMRTSPPPSLYVSTPREKRRSHLWRVHRLDEVFAEVQRVELEVNLKQLVDYEQGHPLLALVPRALLRLPPPARWHHPTRTQRRTWKVNGRVDPAA